MSGYEQELEKWKNILDSYEKAIGLPEFQKKSTENIQDYIDKNQDISKLDREARQEIAYNLAQYAFYIQRSINREISVRNWADSTMKAVASDDVKKMRNGSYTSYDERLFSVINENSAVKTLFKIKQGAQQRIDRISYLAGYLKNLSEIINGKNN